VQKGADVQNNILYILLGNTIVETIPLATYEPYWNKDEVNTIHISGTSGNTNVWLNGNQILTADATAWTPQNPANIYIGASFSGGSSHDGKIHSFKVWQRLLTSDEIARYSAYRVTKVSGAVRDGMLGYWNFDAHDVNGNTIFDKSRHNDNGTNNGGTSWANGVLNEAWDFDGNTDYVSLANTNLNALFSQTSAFSIAFWYKQDVVEAVNMMGYYDAPRYFQIYMNANGSVFGRIGQGSGGSLVTITSATTGNNNPNNWYHLVYTYDGVQNTRLYLNAVSRASSATQPSEFSSAQNIYVGALNHPTVKGNFDGKMDDVRIYNRVLTGNEISTLYNATKITKINTSSTWYVK